MQKVQASVKRFMELAKQPVLDKPGIPEEATRLLGMRLVIEEAFMELAYSMGLTVVAKPWDGDNCLTHMENVHIDATHEPNLVEIADGIGDGIFVLLWIANSCGIDMVPVLEEICRHNLEKFGPGGYRGDDGKWVKPKDLLPPKIKEVLDGQAT